MLSAPWKPSASWTRTSSSTPTSASIAVRAFRSALWEAIFPDTEVPEGEEAWIDRNAEEAVDAPIAEGDSPVLGD